MLIFSFICLNFIASAPASAKIFNHFWPIPNYHHGLLQPLLLSIHPYPHVKFLFIDN